MLYTQEVTCLSQVSPTIEAKDNKKSKKLNSDVKRMTKVTILLILWVIVNFSVLSCATEVTNRGYDILKRELSTIQTELSAIQSELQSTKEKLSTAQNELNATKSKLNKTEEKLSSTLMELLETKEKLAEAYIVKTKYEELNAKYQELNIKYEELKQQYDAILAGTEGSTEVINEADTEQALFELINKERENNGLSALEWNGGIYSCAKSNNREMSETKSLVDSECTSFQQVFWFLGYGTADRIAETALTAWKNNQYSYTQNVLNSANIGAVAVYESEGILYISFLCYKDIAYID